ncbi:hypothetical protein [Flavobacterium sp.]|uniref:hypothetical protein n=1 Tax=Flavobacterium sp. TaxID=239 RepID=UPI002637CD42|nr:hypothetical protein [Flavobacterium sp.]
MYKYKPGHVIPYAKELNSITGGILSTILLVQLNYWFERYPDGFYKFLEPSNHPAYRPGTSWTEELGMTVAEFRTAFDAIGHRYTSKTKYLQTEQSGADKFLGRYFVSYIDKRSNMTFYVRNHTNLDQKLSEIAAFNDKPKSKIGNSQSPGDAETSSLEIAKAHLQEIQSPDLVYTKTTDQIINSNNNLRPREFNQLVVDMDSCSSDFDGLVMPNLEAKELEGLKLQLMNCPKNDRQSVCDEIEGLRRQQKIKSSPVSLARALITAVNGGTFVPTAGIKIEENRKTALMHSRVLSQLEQDQRKKLPSISGGREAFHAALAEIKANIGHGFALRH